MNNTACANSIASFDFKKHAKVINKISDLITRCFNEKKVDYISINNSYRASWTNKYNGSWHLKGGGGGGGGGVHHDFFVKLGFEIAVDQQTRTVTEYLRGSRTATAKRCPRGSHLHIWSILGSI